jgi:exosortase/archaeosortase family protein
MQEEGATKGSGEPGPSPSSPAPESAGAGLPPVEDTALTTRETVQHMLPGGRAPAYERRKKARKARPHPYANEASTQAELRMSPKAALALWGVLALVLIGSGYLLATRFSPIVTEGAEEPDARWEAMLQVPLWTSLALLAFGFSRKAGHRRFVLVGWLVGAFYLGLWAQDLFYVAKQDYVNYAFALLFGVLFVYLAYHEWLTVARQAPNAAVRFLSISFFVGAGAYFVIDKIQVIRLGLIRVVSDHTKWMLDLFGQGDRAGLVFEVDPTDNKSPTTFFYPDTVQSCPDGTTYSEYARENGGGTAAFEQWCTDTAPQWMDGFWERVLHFDPPPADHLILPVSIILACTALQSIMVFVGLFAGTTASLRRKVVASVVVGAVVYVLNLVRNTGIIWFYGQGHSSFWVMHDAIGKGGSLIAMIAIAFGVFRWFPEFLQALFGVLDLADRDGPLERALKIGRRRPAAAATPVTPPPPV